MGKSYSQSVPNVKGHSYYVKGKIYLKIFEKSSHPDDPTSLLGIAITIMFYGKQCVLHSMLDQIK